MMQPIIRSNMQLLLLDLRLNSLETLRSTLSHVEDLIFMKKKVIFLRTFKFNLLMIKMMNVWRKGI